MGFSLTDTIEDQFEFNDLILNVDMSYDNILLLFEMFDDKEIHEIDKIFIALKMLIEEYDNIKFESFEEAQELFKYILREFIDIDLDESKDEDGSSNIKVYDFKKDAELIYASFFAVYKIDLLEQKGKLHWKKFNVLLTHLDDNSPFKQVIGYRTMKIPSEKEASKEYIQHIRKMKQLYSLEEGPRDVSHVFDTLSTMFKAKE